VRHGRSAKQRLWLGPGRYRRRCRDASTNPTCFADSCVKRYSMRGGNASTYSYIHTHSNTVWTWMRSKPDSNANSNSKGDT
jgi:hypothetical protein